MEQRTARIGVVGAGHNSLVAAALLAEAGHSVDVYERRSVPGGACSSVILECGCVVNDGANALSMFEPDLLQRLGISPSRLEVEVADPLVSAQGRDGRRLSIWGDADRTADEIERSTGEPAAGVRRFFRDMDAACEAYMSFADGSDADDKHLRRELQAIAPGLASLLLDGSLESLMKSYFHEADCQMLMAATTSLFPAPPSAPGTAYSMLYLALGRVWDEPGWGVVAGGMQHLADELADAARRRGARLHTNASVDTIVVKDRRAQALRVGDETTDPLDAVLAGIDPHTVAFELLAGEPHAEPWRDELARFDWDGGCAKLNVVLDQPSVDCPPLLVLNGALPLMEENFTQYARGDWPSQPYLEVTPNSVTQPALSCGRHTPVSVFVLFAPYGTGDAAKRMARSLIERALREAIPDWPPDYLWSEFLGPEDIEARWGMHRGNVDHGPVVPGNRFAERGGMSCAVSATPIAGLRLCGAGSFPGGLVSGRPGAHAARAVAAELGSRR